MSNEFAQAYFHILVEKIATFKTDANSFFSIENLKTFLSKVQSDGVSIVTNLLGYSDFDDDNEFMEKGIATFWYKELGNQEDNKYDFSTEDKRNVLIQSLKAAMHPIPPFYSIEFINSSEDLNQSEKRHLAILLIKLFKDFYAIVAIIDGETSEFEKIKGLELYDLLESSIPQNDHPTNSSSQRKLLNLRDEEQRQSLESEKLITDEEIREEIKNPTHTFNLFKTQAETNYKAGNYKEAHTSAIEGLNIYRYDNSLIKIKHDCEVKFESEKNASYKGVFRAIILLILCILSAPKNEIIAAFAGIGFIAVSIVGIIKHYKRQRGSKK